MSKAGNVRVKPTKIEINGKDYLIKYDFNAFIELEDIYGSLDEAMKIIQGELTVDKEGKPVYEIDIETGEIAIDKETGKQIQKRKISFKAIRDFLWCGLLYALPAMTKNEAGKLLEFTNFKYIIENVVEALTSSMPKVVDDDEKN